MIDFAASGLALLAVLVLAFYVIKGGAKLNGLKHRSNAIQVIETAAIGSRERLVVVNYNDQRYLLGVTAQSVNIIDSHDFIEPVVANKFADTIRDANQLQPS